MIIKTGADKVVYPTRDSTYLGGFRKLRIAFSRYNVNTSYSACAFGSVVFFSVGGKLITAKNISPAHPANSSQLNGTFTLAGAACSWTLDVVCYEMSTTKNGMYSINKGLSGDNILNGSLKYGYLTGGMGLDQIGHLNFTFGVEVDAMYMNNTDIYYYLPAGNSNNRWSPYLRFNFDDEELAYTWINLLAPNATNYPNLYTTIYNCDFLIIRKTNAGVKVLKWLDYYYNYAPKINAS